MIIMNENSIFLPIQTDSNITLIVKLSVNKINFNFTVDLIHSENQNSIQQLKMLEGYALVYTLESLRGYKVLRLVSNLSSVIDVKTFKTEAFWKLFQTESGNHMHRPIYGASETNPSALSRITTEIAQVFDDPTNQTDFYNYAV